VIGPAWDAGVHDAPLFLSRTTDPGSSRKAAVALTESGRASDQRSVVYGALREHPGCTSAELAEAMGVDRFMVARRLPDLRRLEQAVNGPERTCNVNHTRAITWYAAEDVVTCGNCAEPTHGAGGTCHHCKRDLAASRRDAAAHAEEAHETVT